MPHQLYSCLLHRPVVQLFPSPTSLTVVPFNRTVTDGVCAKV